MEPKMGAAVDEMGQDEKMKYFGKMTQYKTYAKGLMDIALLTANSNQLRHAIDMCSPYIIVLLLFSIVLQVVSSILLFLERQCFKQGGYAKCNKYNIAIGVLVILIIVINVVATAFGGPENKCAVEVADMEEGSG